METHGKTMNEAIFLILLHRGLIGKSVSLNRDGCALAHLSRY
jgi:hypothetical protein